MCILCLTKKWRSVPDVYFHDSQKLLVRVLTNISANPEEPKYRSLNAGGKAFLPLKVDGMEEILRYCGFALVNGCWVLPNDAPMERVAEVLDHVLNIYAIRDKEKADEVNKSAAQRKKEKESLDNWLRARFESDRAESSQRPVVTSRSTLVPFSGSAKVSFKDIGVDLNKGGGG